jgi:outer membrane protein OmpA-like peptidoglycan-associated protein/Tol biopolymer transport system component
MKKINLFITLTILSSFSLIAQNKDTKKADKHFDQLEFVDAAKDYEKLVADGKADNYVYAQLAESYYNVFDTEKAERYYYQALENNPAPNSEMIYKYAQMLKANSKYAQSNEWMARFANMRPSDQRAMAFKEDPNYIPKILERGKKFRVENMSINSKYSDFGGTLKDGKLYITSARDVTGENYGWNEEPFLDIFVSEKNSDGSYGAPEQIKGKVNTSYHEGMVAFSPDGKTMYFSRESFFEKEYVKDSITKNKLGSIHLYKATTLGDKWDNIEALNITKDYSAKNPSVSKDGKTLYFASDMPGGYGLFDIYKAPINEDGSVGEHVNLGQKINTEGQEMFPFIGDDGTLYFSSNGHLGLGGLDVFFTKEIDGKFTPIRNVGIPINSNSDDFAFRIYDDTGEGFISSNRPGGLGSDDIYRTMKLQPLCDVLVIATVVDDKTGNPVNGAMVTLYDDQGNKIVSKSTNAEGVAEFIVECDKNTELEVTMDQFDSKKVTVTGTQEKEVNVKISLDPIEKIIAANSIELDPIYFDYDKSNITSKAAFELDKLVQVMTKYPDMVIDATAHTDSRGSDSYNMRLSDRRAKTTVQYVISKGIDKNRIKGKGMGETVPKVDCGANCTEEEYQLNRRSEFIIVKTPMTEMEQQ